MSKTLLATTAFLFAFAVSVCAQGVLGVVEYLKVENQDEFLALENEWNRIYKPLIQSGEIVGCSVFQVMYKTKEEDYNFVKIMWFEGFSKINFRFKAEHYMAAFPGKNEDDWKQFLRRNEANHKVLSSGIFQQQFSLSNGLDHVGKFYRISEINIQPDKSKEYRQLINDIYLPVYREDVNNNHRTAWSLWAKWTGSLDSFEYTTADGYASMDQIDQDSFAECFKKVHPGMDMDQVASEMDKLFVLVNSEMWKLISRVIASNN